MAIASFRRAGAWAPWFAAGLLLVLLLGAVFGEGLVGRAGIDGASLLPYEDALYAPKTASNSPIVNQDTTPEGCNQPFDTLSWRELRSGQWPLWNPDNGFGMPLLADGQSAPFNPLKVMLAGDATGVAEAWFLVSRLALAGFGALVLARYLGASAPASALTALAFTASGTFAYHFHYSDVHALVMLPWLMLAAEWLLAAPNLRQAAVLGLVIALTGAMGHPEAALYAAAAATASVGLGAFARRDGLRVWACLTVAILLAIGLSSATLLPFFELVRHGKGYMFDPRFTAPSHGFGLRAKLGLLALHLLSATARPDAFTLNPFVGVVALALAPLGLRARIRRPAVALLGVATGVLLVGPPGPFLPLVSPPPNASYVPPLISLALALLAGAGLERLVAMPWKTALRPFCLNFGGLAIAAGVLQITSAPRHIGDFRASAATAVAALCLLLLIRAPRARALLLVTLAALELGWGLRVANPPQAPFAYAAPPIVRYLRAQPGLFRVSGGLSALIPNTNLMYGLDSLDASDAFHSARYEAFMSALLGKALPPGNVFALYVPTRGEVPTPFQPALLDLANVRYVIGAPDRFGVDHLRPWLAHYPVVMRQGEATLYENPHAMPRAFVCYAADYLPEGIARAARRLASHANRWRTHALIETPDGHAPAGFDGAEQPITPARVLQRGPESIAVRATLRRPGWLILTDSYYPGWRAKVDGVSARIYPADVAFRGVYLGPGTHTIEFVFAPSSFHIGLLLTSASLALALLLLLRFDFAFARPLPA